MIFLYQRYLTHYKAQVFIHLNKAFHNQLVVCYGNPPQQGASISKNGDYPFATIQVRNTWIGGETAVWQPFWPAFRRHGRPDVVITEGSARMIYLWPLVLYCRLAKIPLVMWGHGGSRRRKSSTSRDPRDVLSRWMVRLADAYLCYTDGVRAELARFVDPGKLFVASNTLDTDLLFSLREDLERRGKEDVKRQLRLHAPHYLCFLGRLIPSKQPAYVLDVLRTLQHTDPDIGLIFIGDGPERPALEAQARQLGLREVHFLGAVLEPERSAPYLFASDVMVTPGEVGLSVNHGLSFGLPTVTRRAREDGPFHGPEAEYIIPGKTGILVDDGDTEAMADAVRNILAERGRYYDEAVSFAKARLTVDRFIRGFQEAVAYVGSMA